MSLTRRLVEYISACFTGIWIESHEHEDALREIAQMCRKQDWKLASWDVDRGLQIPGSEQPADAGGNDPLAAIRSVNALADADSSALLVLQNFHRFTQSAEIVQALASQINAGKQNRTFIIVLSPIVEKQKLRCIRQRELGTAYVGRTQLRCHTGNVLEQSLYYSLPGSIFRIAG